jgi:hypothetical protein
MKNYLICLLIFISGCSDVSEDLNSIDKSYEEISKFLDQVIIKNIDKKAKQEFLQSFKYINESTGAQLFKKKKVYLFYEGLSSGGIWSKPGAKNFGGERVGTFYFDEGPVSADAIAHIELEGNRNYFYVLIENENLEGWVGRPYVMSDKGGKTFLMPNPITGERVRNVVDIKLDMTSVRKLFVEEPVIYAPRYSEIPWKNCICNFPEEIQREGYRLYMEALQDGEQKVEALVNEYMSTVVY